MEPVANCDITMFFLVHQLKDDEFLPEVQNLEKKIHKVVTKIQ